MKFEKSPKARASIKEGVLYAIDGQDGFIYYGQLGRDKSVGFFKHRDIELSRKFSPPSHRIMSRFMISFPSIGRALRSGMWLKLGKFELHDDLQDYMVLVQWPVDTLDVLVWKGDKIIKKTNAFDPEIQEFELMQVYDAVAHVAKRLQVDFDPSAENPEVGGSVRKERKLKELLAQRFPDQPWHQLPKNWEYL